MKKSTAVLLALIATVLLVLAFMNRSTDTANDTGKAFLPELKANLDNVSEVILTDATDSVTLQRQAAGNDASWVVTDRDGYPANVPNIRKLLRNLADTTLVERKTDNPELYGRLGLADPDNATEDDVSRRVQIKAADNTVADIIIGNRSDRGSYMRKVGEQQSWLVNRDFLPGTSATDWLDDDLLAISREDLQKVEVQPETGPAYEIGRDSEGEFQISPVPTGRQISASGIARVTAALRNLQITDVRKPTANNATTDDGWALSRWYTKSGLIVSIKSRKEGNTLVAGVSANTAANASEEATAAAAALNDKTTGRLLLIPGHQANNLRLTLEQVTEATETQTTPE